MSTINEQMLKAIKEEMDLVISSGQEKVIVDYDKAQRVRRSKPYKSIHCWYKTNLSIINSRIL